MTSSEVTALDKKSSILDVSNSGAEDWEEVQAIMGATIIVVMSVLRAADPPRILLRDVISHIDCHANFLLARSDRGARLSGLQSCAIRNRLGWTEMPA